MANYERGSDDVRVFDGAEDEEDIEGSRLPLLIVIALLVLAAFGAVVWLAYQRGVAQGHSEVPRTIAAEPGPAKVAPANPGGTQTPYTGLKIFQQRAPSDEEANVDTAPPPPSDSLKPAPQPSVPAPAAAPPTPPPAAATPVPKPVAAPPAPPSVTPKPAPAPVTPKPAPVQQAVVAPPKPAPVPAVTEAPAAAPPAGAGLLQIGAYKSEAEANAAWKSYRAKHSSLLSGMSSDVKQVDLGAKGTWYRLRIVAGSKDDASSLCTKLKADGGDCLLAK
jgi:cell division protein FtsN